MTSPFKKPSEIPNWKEPYTDVLTPMNLWPRTTYCRYCKYEVVTGLPNPKCGICGTFLITKVINDVARGNS